MDERQSFETLSRDLKSATRALSQLEDKVEQLTQKRNKLVEDDRTHTQKKSEVRVYAPFEAELHSRVCSWRPKWRSFPVN